MEIITSVVTVLSTLLGVAMGGWITLRSQRTSYQLTSAIESRRERQRACIDYLSAIRRYRRFLMYSDPDIEVVDPTPDSRGTVIIAGRTPYDSAMDDALTRLAIVVRSAAFVDEATSLARRLNDFIRARAALGKGMVPDQAILDLREAEDRFIAIAHRELDLLDAEPPLL